MRFFSRAPVRVKFPERGLPRRPPPPPLKFGIAVFHYNAPDLTRKAVASIESWWPNVTVLDNSPTRELLFGPDDWFRQRVKVVGNVQPLTFTQSMNAAREWAIDAKLLWFATMHNDAEVVRGDLRNFETDAELMVEDGFGRMYTNYDALVAFSTEAVRQVGPWDICLRQYGSDEDFYRRMDLAGFGAEQCHCLTVSHKPSQTLKRDPRLQWFHEKMHGHELNYFRSKWGGLPGQERFKAPWNGEGFAQ